jgi:hypothetical protein
MADHGDLGELGQPGPGLGHNLWADAGNVAERQQNPGLWDIHSW